MFALLLAAVAFAGECDNNVPYNQNCLGCTSDSNCAWMVATSTCLPKGQAAVLNAYQDDKNSVALKPYLPCPKARSVEDELEGRIARLVRELAARENDDL